MTRRMRRFWRMLIRGVVPREMEEPGIGDVSITLVDKKGEDYVPPKRKVVAFSGGGQRLGGAASAQTVAAVAAPPSVDDALGTIVLDETQPVAVVQVRLSDGTRLRARLNDHHTVGQLRAFVRLRGQVCRLSVWRRRSPGRSSRMISRQSRMRG